MYSHKSYTLSATEQRITNQVHQNPDAHAIQYSLNTYHPFKQYIKIPFFTWRSEHDVTLHSRTLIGWPGWAWHHAFAMTLGILNGRFTIVCALIIKKCWSRMLMSYSDNSPNYNSDNSKQSNHDKWLQCRKTEHDIPFGQLAEKIIAKQQGEID